MLSLSHMIKSTQRGFTIIELVIVMTLTGLISTMVYSFFTTNLTQYLGLQAEGMAFGSLSLQSQRVATVARGLTDITQATDSEITMYAYFSPRDSTVSLIRYYKSADGGTLYADITPMTADPPIGTPITAETKTYAVVKPFYTVSGVKTFKYFDSGGGVLTPPIADLHVIQQIQINLAAPVDSPSANGYDLITVQVSIRNRKINL